MQEIKKEIPKEIAEKILKLGRMGYGFSWITAQFKGFEGAQVKRLLEANGIFPLSKEEMSKLKREKKFRAPCSYRERNGQFKNGSQFVDDLLSGNV